jgi:phosphatidylserine/phosphatidylglycerophosphate/cardiolipin synthase-like enzyme
MPKPWFINAMHECVHRGVKVDVIIPKATESFFVDRVHINISIPVLELWEDYM